MYRKKDLIGNLLSVSVERRAVVEEIRTNINVPKHLLAQHLAHPLRQLQAHVLPTTVNRDSVNAAVGSCEVQVLEQIRGVRLGLHNLRKAGCLALLDEDGLAGQDVDNVFEAELDEGNRFRGDKVVGGTLQGI